MSYKHEAVHLNVVAACLDLALLPASKLARHMTVEIPADLLLTYVRADGIAGYSLTLKKETARHYTPRRLRVTPPARADALIAALIQTLSPKIS